MISCISPSSGSCEHTLNTLRYADRVKSLSKGGNTKKEQFPIQYVSSSKESTYPTYPLPGEAEQIMEWTQETRPLDASRKGVDNVTSNSSMEPERNSSSMIPSYQHRGKEETSSRSGLNDRERGELKSNQIGLASKAQSFQDSVNSHEVKVTKVSPPRRKANRDEKSERQSNYMKKEEISRTVVKQQQQLKPQQQRLSSTLASHVSSKQSEKESSYEEEEALVAAHRKEIENTMEIVWR